MMKLKKTTKNNLITYGVVIAGFIIAQALMGGGVMSNSLKGQLVPICAYVVMAVSLNLTVGVLGELSLGHAGFMSVGAFSGAVAATSLEGLIGAPSLRLLIAIIIGAALAALVGFLVGIPALRLKGDYLAIVTLAFGEIVVNIMNCLYVGIDENGLRFSVLRNVDALGLSEGGRVIVNGPVGATGITRIASFGAGFVLILATLFITLNFINSRAGRAVLAVRDNSIAAESVGISITKYKMTAFVLSAAMAGAAGVLFALNINTTVATKFNFNTSILVLVFVVLGGLGNIWGSVIAAAALTVLPEALRGFNSWRMLVYAIVLILVMIITNAPAVRDFLARHSINFKLTNRKKNVGGDVTDG